MRPIVPLTLAALLFVCPLHAADPLYGAAAIRAHALWPVATGRGVKVAIVDTGIDPTHPALQAAYRGGYDFVHNDATPDEETSEAHGTSVAGVVLQVAPDAEIYALKIFGSENSFDSGDLIRAIDWAIAHQIDVINMSFALKVKIDDVRKAMNRAEAAGIIVCAAGGNGSANEIDYPARFDTAIAVGATGSTLAVASFSNRGPELDVAAPGVDIYAPALHGKGLAAEVRSGGTIVHAAGFGGALNGDVSGVLVDCGSGRVDQVPESVRGNVALVRLDASVSFGTALGNLVRAGAVAIVVLNSEPRFFYANVNPPGSVPPTVSIGSDDAARLTAGSSVRVVFTPGDYKFTWGTSLATPHVTGAVALLRELVPGAAPSLIRNVLTMSAMDAGPAGRDDAYGFGVINVWEAARLLAPEKLPAPPARRRSAP